MPRIAIRIINLSVNWLIVITIPIWVTLLAALTLFDIFHTIVFASRSSFEDRDNWAIDTLLKGDRFGWQEQSEGLEAKDDMQKNHFHHVMKKLLKDKRKKNPTDPT